MGSKRDPESKWITVSDLIARTGGDDEAFPRADSVSVRRTESAEEAEPKASAPRATGASGMPEHTAPKPAVEKATRGRVIGASGMPDYTPSTNAVTGIIPVVSDDPDAVYPVERDDLLGEDLPAIEVREASTAPVAPGGTDSAGPDGAAEFTELDAETTAALAATEAGAEGTSGDHLASAAEVAEAEEAADAAQAAQEAVAEETGSAERSALWGWLSLIGEVVLGLVVGAGIFWGFTVLWKRYIYLALILAVLVIFAIVTFTYALRKRDLPTTLLALGVGLLITIGPLVMLV